MDNHDIVSTLHEEILIKGVPIEKSEMFKTLSDMNVSDQDISDYSNSLHNLLKAKGTDETVKKIITIFRINPLVAVRIIESCSLVDEIDNLAYSIKPLFSAVRNDGHVNSDLVLLNRKQAPYVALLIEAVFQRSFGESGWWDPDMFLKYAQEEDKKLYTQGTKAKYLNSYNIRHILTHIPDNRQIELINWFWDKHCYAASNHGIKESFTGGRVKAMIDELAEGSLWHHLENVNESDLSERELARLEKEKEGIKHFIESVLSEGRHLQFIQKILGRDNFYDKLQVLLGDGFGEKYDKLLENQQKIIAREAAEEEVRNRHQKYEALVQKVKDKYKKENEFLQWHGLGDKKHPQINLWSYFQGCNFENVKLMVLSLDWGSINDSGREMDECKRKLRIFMRNPMYSLTKYYSCKYRSLDYSLEELFHKCFSRNIRKTHYTDLFFSTLCLGYRKSSSISIDDGLVSSDINAFMPDLLKIICPQSIFCLGEKVYQLFVGSIDPNGNDRVIEGDGEKNVFCRDILINGSTVHVYSMPHCGNAGIKRLPLNKQVEYWNMAKKDMETFGLSL